MIYKSECEASKQGDVDSCKKAGSVMSCLPDWTQGGSFQEWKLTSEDRNSVTIYVIPPVEEPSTPGFYQNVVAVTVFDPQSC